MQPQLKTSKDGHQTLYVYYDNSLANFDQAIESAERRFGLTNDFTVTVLALPENSKLRGNRNLRTSKLVDR